MTATVRLDFPSPIGRLGVEASARAVVDVRFDAPEQEELGSGAALDLARQVRRELEEYLAGERRTFTVPFEPRGTPFQLRVWEEMVAIPYGKTLSYGEIARRVASGDGEAPGEANRAVGRACGANPIPLIVPCHRVLASGGHLGGFGGGVRVKQWLLTLEALGRPPSPAILGPGG